jgi:voltage-gated sodium channel
VGEKDLLKLLETSSSDSRRVKLAQWVESKRVQTFVIAVIILNAIILGLETDAAIMARFGALLLAIDKLCLGVFLIEIGVKLFAYRLQFWRSGWNIFDFLVVGVALVPGGGAWSVLRSLRVLRVLRLLTAVPSLKKVISAFVHSIPGLSSVIAVMAIFFYTAAVLSTRLFGETHPDWFGSMGASLFTLFQIMTLESWSMGIVRPVMEAHPWAWAYFVPFIILATFTILNLFIGIIVSTMQELALTPDFTHTDPEMIELLERIDGDLRSLRAQLDKKGN